MARPTKQGIDYFPVDTEFDDDLQLFVAEVGSEGLGILLTIWQAIYKSNGYYIDYDDKFPLKIKQKCFSPVEKVVNVVDNAIKFNIFNIDIYGKYKILTSRGIQKRYFTAARLKKQIEIIPQIILIDVSNVDNAVNIVDNPKFYVNNATNVKEEEEVEEGVKKTPVSPNNIPYQKIVDLYHEVLPELPRVKILTPTRKSQIKARWMSKYKSRDGTPIDTLDFWKGYFEFVSKSKFLMGQNDRNWKPDLEWLTKESKFAGVIEGKHH